MSKRTLYRLGIGICIIVFIVVAFPVFTPGGNGLSKAQIGEAQSDRLLREFGQRILDYRQTHGGTSPRQLSDLAASDEVDSEKNIQHLMDTYIENPIFSFALPSKPASRVLVFEKSGLWSDGSIGACFDDLKVKRLTPAEFDGLGVIQ
jgi:hypothetical protein